MHGCAFSPDPPVLRAQTPLGRGTESVCIRGWLSPPPHICQGHQGTWHQPFLGPNKAATMNLSPAASVGEAGGLGDEFFKVPCGHPASVLTPVLHGGWLGTPRAPLPSFCPHSSAPDSCCTFKGHHLEILDNSSFQRDLTSRLIF